MCGHGEVEHLEVLFVALAADRLRVGRDAALDEPAKHDLGEGLPVRTLPRNCPSTTTDDVTSIIDSNPNPTTAVDPAARPAPMASTASIVLTGIVIRRGQFLGGEAERRHEP